MGSMATTTLMSFAEFERLDGGADQLELLRGELIRVPPARTRHMRVGERLRDQLRAAIERLRPANPDLKVGEVHTEFGYKFVGEPASWLIPDVSITHPDQPEDEDYYLGPPLIAIEVASPSDTAPHLDAKIEEYLANGTAEVWVIYPARRHAWVYDGSGTARQETQAFRTHLLPGVEISFHHVL